MDADHWNGEDGSRKRNFRAAKFGWAASRIGQIRFPYGEKGN